MCVLDLPSDYMYMQMHNNGPTVHSIYIFDTVQNAFQLVDFTRQHYFERALSDSGLVRCNILATNNLFSELHCSCQTSKLRVSQTPVPGTRGRHGKLGNLALPSTRSSTAMRFPGIKQFLGVRQGLKGAEVQRHAVADGMLLEKRNFFILLQVCPPLSSGRTKIFCRVDSGAVLG